MYRLNYPAKENVKTKAYSDDEYLAFQIWQLSNTFQRTLMAIKDVNLNFVAITASYAKEFDFNTNLNSTNINALENEKLSTIDIQNQEHDLLQNQQLQDSIFLYKAKNSKTLSAYLMRKRPIINPDNNHGVGVLIVAKQQEIGEFRSLFLNKLLGINKKMKLPDLNAELNDHQYQIMLCLLYGYHSRKEIAAILSDNSTKGVNEIRIKNLLSNLYNKFECSTPTQLIQQISQSRVKLEIPVDSTKEGSYPI